MFKKGLAEAFGTFVLVFFGCGSAVIVGNNVFSNYSVSAKVLIIALAFGLAIVAAAYAIGRISGCHVNPAVSLAVLINGGMTVGEFCVYFIAQFIGAIAGSGALALIMKFTNVINAQGGLGQNGFGTESAVNLSAAGAVIVEVILTFVFVMTILGVTREKGTSHMAGLVIGLTLALIHIVGIMLTGTSVNPARSLAPALVLLIFDGKSLAFEQVWVFIVAPFAGAALAGIFHKLLFKGVPTGDEEGKKKGKNK